MKKDQIHLADWHRILFGDAPPVFLLEVFLRALLIYVALLVVVRLLGKRMNGQVTIMEMAVMLTLGAIVAPGMQTPDRGILAAVFLLVCLLAYHRGLTLLEFIRPGVEKLTQGDVSVLVKDGVMDLGQLRKARVSREQVFGQLRDKQIYNLGSVKRVYLEACGVFSIYNAEPSAPGLSIVPGHDAELRCQQPDDHGFACKSCGAVVAGDPPSKCRNCGSGNWEPAVMGTPQTEAAVH